MLGNNNYKYNKKFKAQSLLGVLPALLIGTYTMNYFGVSKSIWFSNFIFLSLCIAIGLISNKFKLFFASINLNFFFLISITLLLSSFFNEGSFNVHRWIKIASVNLNIGLIVSPIILIQLSRLKQYDLSIFIVVFITLIFLFQPDASQVTAFSISVLILFLNRIESKIAKFFFLSFVLIVIIIAWKHLDNLQPVNYVERIIQMTGKINKFLPLLSLFSLALLLLPFFIVYIKEKNQLALSLGIYFALTTLASFFGNFPVMIMGYGISPIIGYFFALFWLISKQEIDAKFIKTNV
jgi:hypothetical protein